MIARLVTTVVFCVVALLLKTAIHFHDIAMFSGVVVMLLGIAALANR